MQRRGFAKTIGMLFVIIAVIGVLAYIATRPRIGWPTDDRRVVHPSGFSIVKPADWEEHISFGTPGESDSVLKFLPKETIGSPGFFSVTQLGSPATQADLISKGYTATTFQNEPAWEHTHEHDLTIEYTRSMVFNRGGHSYDIALRRPKSEPCDSGVWKAYLESFRLETGKTPATIPVALPFDLTPTTAPAAK